MKINLTKIRLICIALLLCSISRYAGAQLFEVENGLTELTRTNEALRFSGNNSYLAFYRSGSLAGYLYHDNTDMTLASSLANGDLILRTTSGPKIFMNNNGNVGIGTVSPNHTMHVNGNTRTRGLRLTGEDYFSGGDDGVIYSDDGAGSDIFLVANDAVVIDLDKDNNEQGDFIVRDGSNDANLLVIPDNDRAIFYDRGVVVNQPNHTVSDPKAGMTFLNTTSTEWRIMHSGAFLSFVLDNVRQAYIETDGTWVVTSDRRLKEGIKPLESTLDRITQLKPARYSYKSDKQKNETIGFIAQDVLELFPEAVSQSEDGFYAVNYSMFGVLAVKAIQEQEDRIAKLEKQVQLLLQQVK